MSINYSPREVDCQLNVQSRLATSESIVILARFPALFAPASVAQLAEQLICNQQVVGSSPTAGPMFDEQKPSGLGLND